MDNKSALFSKLVNHYRQKPISFHVPGHKFGRGFNPIGKSRYKDLLTIDLTELNGLDYLHQPKEVILEAQQKLAELVQADYSFFLVNGSTSGNLAMILATINPGEKIIVQSNVHKSVIDGLFLAKANPIYINPALIPQLGIAGCVDRQALADMLIQNSDAKAVLLTNPNYYGIGADLTDIAKLVHQYKIPLLVDEAHGAHFGFHPSFPASALVMGADVVVQSTHKTLSAMTMGSVLHVKSNFVDVERLKLFLSMVQSSSPSYPIMASIELTYSWIKEQGACLWEKQLDAISWLYENTIGLKNIKLITDIDKCYYKDPLKIIIQTKNNLFTGFNLQALLEERGIYFEMADLYNALAIITLGNSFRDVMRLKQVLFEIDNVISLSLIGSNEEMFRIAKEFTAIFDYNKGNSIPIEKVLYRRNISLPVKEAIGEISAKAIMAYPPGIPIINYGEEITKEAIEYLLLLKSKGVKFQGLEDETNNYIRVLDRTNIID